MQSLRRQVSDKGVPEARSPTFSVTSRWEPTFSPGASRISTPGFPCGNTRSTVPEISRYLMPETKVWIRMPKIPPQISKKESPKQDPRHFPLPPAGQTMQVIPVFPMPNLTPPQVSSKGVPEAKFPTFPVTSRWEPTFSPGASRISTPGFPCGNTRSTVPEIFRYLLPASKVWIRMPKTPPRISKKESPKQDPRHFPLPPAGQTMQVIPVFPVARPNPTPGIQ
jgi:hypothetical protein